MKVKCLRPVLPDNPVLSEKAREVIKNILTVGDNFLLPQPGQEYEVIGFGNLNGIECYELEGLDTSNYGAKLLFRKEYFEVSDTTFVPNTYVKFGLWEGPARVERFYGSKLYDLKLKGEKNNE